MTIENKTNRRSFLVKVGASVIASQIPTKLLFADQLNRSSSLIDLSKKILSRVNELANDRSVSLTILQPKGSLGNIKPIGDMFQSQTNITIKYIEASLDEINAKIMAQSISKQSSFDIALPATFGLPDLIEANAIRDLDDFVARYEPINYKASMLYSIGDHYKSKFYGYQTDGDAYLMFYNKSWLEDNNEKINFKNQFGYDLEIPETWQQLDHMIQFFHRPKEDRFGGALFRSKDYIAWEWWSRFHAKGTYPFDDQLIPQINSTAGIEALTELINTSQYLYPQARSNGLFENWEAFSQGNMFCNIGWGGTQKFLNKPDSNIRNNLLFGPLPGGNVNDQLIQAPYFNWGWNYTVSSTSKEPELAYLFSLYACSPEISTIAVQYPDGYFDPFRTEHYECEKIQNTYSKPFLDAHLLSMKESIPDLYLTGQGEYWDALKEYLSLAEIGKMSPKFALDATARIWNQINKQYGISNQLEQWRFLKNQYPASIKDKLT